MRTFWLPLISLTLLFTGCSPKQHTATALIEIPRSFDLSGPRLTLVGTTALDVLTEKTIIESDLISKKVAQQIHDLDLPNSFLKPYIANSAEAVVDEPLQKNLRVTHKPKTYILEISYTHPTPEIAVQIANLFAQTYIDDHTVLRPHEIQQAIEEIRTYTLEPKEKVKAAQDKIDALITKNNGKPPSQQSNEEEQVTTYRTLLENQKQAKRHLDSLSEDQTQAIQSAQESYIKAEAAAKQQEAVLREQSRLFVEHHSRLRELEVQQGYLDHLETRMSKYRNNQVPRPTRAYIIQTAELE